MAIYPIKLHSWHISNNIMRVLGEKKQSLNTCHAMQSWSGDRWRPGLTECTCTSVLTELRWRKCLLVKRAYGKKQDMHVFCVDSLSWTNHLGVVFNTQCYKKYP